MSLIIQAVKHEHPSTNTIYHCLYGYYFKGLSKAHLSRLYGKSPSTIANWINKFEENGEGPILHLDEAVKRFQERFGVLISVSSVCRILHESGLTWKVLERRAIQINVVEIA
ncbi:hypothetical protein DFJ73DRAFT_777509 [Zopfochytrium polystomum]|nr:hypothetical protein DFJ73DRAFT_777509 [Zopfochytrium polystomum]